MRQHRMRFHSQMGVIGTLASIGLIALCGEPDESLSAAAWLSTFGCQLAVFAACWLSAWLLCRKWGLSRKMNMLMWIERSRRVEF